MYKLREDDSAVAQHMNQNDAWPLEIDLQHAVTATTSRRSVRCPTKEYIVEAQGETEEREPVHDSKQDSETLDRKVDMVRIKPSISIASNQY